MPDFKSLDNLYLKKPR